MVNIFEQYDGSDRHNVAAAYVSVWSTDSHSMLPLNRARIKTFPLSIFMFGGGTIRKPLGHIGISKLEDHEAVIGGFVVDPQLRGRGLGFRLLSHLMSGVDGDLPGVERYISNVNEESTELFIRAGGVVLGQRDVPASTGCNTVIDLTHAVVRSRQGVLHES